MVTTILHEHTPAWRDEFELLRDIYLKALGELAIAVEHVGSTAIPGIKAKPIIDINIVIAGYNVFPKVVDCLAILGYKYNGDQGIVHREVFKRRDDLVPYTSPSKEWTNHHLYVCPEFSEEHAWPLIFRDYLRSHEDAKREYERVKVEIAARSDGDRKKYAAIKEVECKGIAGWKRSGM